MGSKASKSEKAKANGKKKVGATLPAQQHDDPGSASEDHKVQTRQAEGTDALSTAGLADDEGSQGVEYNSEPPKAPKQQKQKKADRKLKVAEKNEQATAEKKRIAEEAQARREKEASIEARRRQEAQAADAEEAKRKEEENARRKAADAVREARENELRALVAEAEEKAQKYRDFKNLVQAKTKAKEELLMQKDQQRQADANQREEESRRLLNEMENAAQAKFRSSAAAVQDEQVVDEGASSAPGKRPRQLKKMMSMSVKVTSRIRLLLHGSYVRS